MEMKQNDLNNRTSRVNNSSRRPSQINNRNGLCVSDNQMQLYTSLKNRHFFTFKKIITSTAVDVNYCYENPDYKTCLEIAVCDHTPEFVDLLLKHGADPNLRNLHHHRAALHFAIERGDVEIVKRLLKVENIDVNILSNGNTPLMKVVKQIEEDEENMDKYIECCELLLKANADVNIPDANGKPPIYIAVVNKYQKIVELILDSKMDVDIDSYKDRRGKCVRDLIHLSNIYTKELPQYQDKRKCIILMEKMMLFRMLHQEDEEQFIETLKNFITSTGDLVVNLDNNVETLLQVACRKGLYKCVKKLLDRGAKVNATGPDNHHKPIEIVCLKGYYSILEMMLGHDKIQVPPTILHTVVKYIQGNSPKRDYKICLDLLLNDPRINVNMTDHKMNTPLHYAVRYGDHDSIMKLLNAGACISMVNNFHQPPLADMSPKTLHTFLDECLQTNDERCVDDNYEIRFNYNFLIPPSNNAKCFDNQCSISVTDDLDEEKEIRNNNEAFLSPETDALLYMSQNPELRPLLKHPVLTSFLFLKWQRISWLFYTNLTFYSLFCFLLIGYILLGYGYDRPNVIHEVIPEILHFTLVVVWILLMIRELFQFLVSPKVYLKNFENLIEIALILVTFSVVFYEPVEHVRQQISAVAILLSATEFLLLIGQHPSISTYIVMLRTVSWNFFKFLLWYSILIIAFALSFYTLFREADPKEPTEKSNDEEPNFFLDPGMSLFKTIVMLTGEFEAGSINFKAFPVTSHLVFVMFVFLIAIVLFNLLNGLAVSDTALIKQDAELVGYVSRIQLISYFEAMLLGETPPFARFVQKICCCCSISARNIFCIQPIAEKICVFPDYLPAARIAIRPNQGKKIIFSSEKKVLYDSKPSIICCLFNWCKEVEMEAKVIKAAKVVIADKNNVTELDEIKKTLMICLQSISKCDQYVTKHDNDLQDISKALTNITKILDKS